MKHTNKKGFTIVELVIVIAVIAILAAVLIPTFSNLIKKANLSADQQAVRQMNTVLAAEQDLGANIDRVIDVLAENGYNSKSALIPVTKGHAFFYYVDYACIVLVNTEKGEVVYPAEVVYTDDAAKAINLEGSAKYIDVVATDITVLQSALNEGSQDITLTDNMTLTEEVNIPQGAHVVLDLNGKTLSSVQESNVRSKYMNVRGSLTVVNGTIDCRGIKVFGELTIAEDANVIIANVDDNGGSALRIQKGATVEINGGVYLANNGDYKGTEDDANWDNEDNWGYEPNVINNEGTLVINGGTFEANSSFLYAVNNVGTMTINGGTFIGYRGCIDNSGSLTINGGTFSKDVTVPSSHVLYLTSNTTVNGGTFTGTVFVADDCTLTVSGGTFSVEIDKVANVTIAEGKTVTNNNDGTWTVQ